jgi:hypothetical protein
MILIGLPGRPKATWDMLGGPMSFCFKHFPNLWQWVILEQGACPFRRLCA